MGGKHPAENYMSEPSPISPTPWSYGPEEKAPRRPVADTTQSLDCKPRKAVMKGRSPLIATLRTTLHFPSFSSSQFPLILIPSHVLTPLAASSCSRLPLTCGKVQNSFAFIMVSGQLIYFHLAISKWLLIHLAHSRISRSLAKTISGTPTHLTHNFWVPHRGGGCGVMESKVQHLVRTSQEENATPLAQLVPNFTFMDTHLGSYKGWLGASPGAFQHGVSFSPGIYLCLGANGIQ